jgi:hypothetical protein
MKWKSIVCGAILSVALAAPANAAPMGTFTISDQASGVSVGLTFIDWDSDGPPSGTFEMGAGTNLTYTGGTLVATETGVVQDITAVPIANFFTFDQDPLLSFDLAGLGPGSANTDCAGLAVGETCSPFVGSPFRLTLEATNITSISLIGFGTATDGDGISTWQGLWTTQFTDREPVDIQSFFGCVEGDLVTDCDTFGQDLSIFNTYSGSFTATVVPVPEPTMLALLGLGLLGAGARARRRRQ